MLLYRRGVLVEAMSLWYRSGMVCCVVLCSAVWCCVVLCSAVLCAGGSHEFVVREFLGRFSRAITKSAKVQKIVASCCWSIKRQTVITNDVHFIHVL